MSSFRHLEVRVLLYDRVSIDDVSVRFCQALVSEASAWESRELPSAGFRQNAAQSSSVLNRVKLITTFPPRQYQRQGSQYFDKFRQLSLCNCKADVYEAEVGLSLVFVLYSRMSSPGPGLANLCALTVFEFFA